MSQALLDLIDVLTLERLDDHIFRGKCEDLGLPQVFGGQVMAQSLMAAMQIVGNERDLHSCHLYFLRAGDVNYPIIYQTEILREGRSFTSVSVNAIQHDEIICRMMSSFQMPEDGLEHQSTMPQVDMPEQWVSENDVIRQLANYLPEKIKKIFQVERPFDVRVKYPVNPFGQNHYPAEQFLWVKSNGNITINKNLQKCLLIYFSDFHCISTMLQCHGKGALNPDMRIATIDHAMWFHRDFDISDWLLFSIDSTNASATRGLSRGQVYTHDGQLVASYQQEGLIRKVLA
ncbi:acyl-CoA thioesterase II [Pasteurellaceae bacterium 15-036681]|nr:acyl-CoA thioesterase II [Pasteurellaceae bacterium 15-036681]